MCNLYLISEYFCLHTKGNCQFCLIKRSGCVVTTYSCLSMYSTKAPPLMSCPSMHSTSKYIFIVYDSTIQQQIYSTNDRMEIISDVYSVPLSLQEMCYYCLVGHLEQYPQDLLCLLPTMIRHKLFLRLPAIDLHQLENSPVAKNFEMNYYWKAIYEHHFNLNTNHLIACISQDEDKTGYKILFLNEVIQSVTSPIAYYPLFSTRKTGCTCHLICPNPLAKLLSVHFCFSFFHENHPFDTHVKSVFTSSRLKSICPTHKYVIPNRFGSLYIGDPWTNWDSHALTSVKILVDVFNKTPRSIECEYHNLSNLLHSENEFIKQFFKGVISLTLTCRSAYCHSVLQTQVTFIDLPNHDPTDILGIILSSKYPSLKRIETLDKYLRGSSTAAAQYILRQQLYAMVGFFATGFGSPRNLPNFLPYRGLEELEIGCLTDEMEIKEGKTVPDHAYPMSQLAAIIQNQDQLKRVSLHGLYTPTPGCDRLIIALTSLACKPTFNMLCIQGVAFYDSKINSHVVAQLLVSFLTSPTMHEQSLIFCDVSFVGKCNKCFTDQISILPKESQEQKTISLTRVSLGLEIVDVLTQIPPVCLKQFLLNKINSISSLAALCNLPNITTTELSLEMKTIYENMCIGEVLSPLVLNHNIKTLIIKLEQDIQLSQQTSLGILISEHAKHFKSLRSITIEQVSSTCFDEPNISVLYSSLVDLAQVVPLELKLYNMRDQVKVLYHVFKERGAIQKFRKLELADHCSDEYISLMNDITEIHVVTNHTMLSQ